MCTGHVRETRTACVCQRFELDTVRAGPPDRLTGPRMATASSTNKCELADQNDAIRYNNSQPVGFAMPVAASTSGRERFLASVLLHWHDVSCTATRFALRASQISPSSFQLIALIAHRTPHCRLRRSRSRVVRGLAELVRGAARRDGVDLVAGVELCARVDRLAARLGRQVRSAQVWGQCCSLWVHYALTALADGVLQGRVTRDHVAGALRVELRDRGL